MKKSNKKVKIIVLLIIMILIVTLVIKILEIKNEKEKQKEERILNENILNETVEKYVSDKLFPKNFALLYSKYKGELPLDDFYMNLKVAKDYWKELSQETENSSEKDIFNYFENNKEEIINNLGIENKEKFIDFINYINKYDIENKNYMYCNIDKNSIKNEEEYLEFNINFYYENMDSSLDINVKILNKITNKAQVIYGIDFE